MPIPDSKPVQKGLLDDGMSFLDKLLTVVDTPARPVRTFLHTGSPTQALESLGSPESAASVEDLREDIGIPNFGTEDGSFEPVGDTADFLVNFGIGAGTDPLSLVGIGELSKAGSAAKGMMASLRTKAATEGFEAAAEEFLKRTGKTLTKELLQSDGLERTLGGRLRAGQQSIANFQVPFTNLSADIPVLTKAIDKAAAPVADLLGGAVDKGIGAVAKTKAGGTAMKWAKQVKQFVSEGLGNPAMDQLMPYASTHGALAAKRELPKIQGVIEELTQANIPQELHGFADEYAQLVGTEARRKQIAQLTGTPLESLGKRSRDLDDLSKAMDEAGLTSAQKDVVALGANKIGKFYDTVLSAERAAGKEINFLGDRLMTELGSKQDALKKVLTGLSPENATILERMDPVTFVNQSRDLYGNKFLLENPEVKKLLTDYVHARKLAATVPAYSFMRVSDEAMEGLLTGTRKLKPEHLRKVLNEAGEFGTTDEVNAVIAKHGTKATGGRATENFFETSLPKVMADRLTSLSSAVTRDKMGRGFREIFTEELPADVRALRDRRAGLTDELKRLATDPDAQTVARGVPGKRGKRTIQEVERQLADVERRLEKAMSPQGGRMPAGYAAAEDVVNLPGMEGRMVKGEVAEMLKDAQARLRSPDTYNKIGQPLKIWSRIWKSWQLTWPGTIERNKIGNLMLRAQGGGIDPLSLADEPNIARMMIALRKGSNVLDDLPVLDNIKFNIGKQFGDSATGEVTGKQLLRLAEDYGVLDNGFWNLEFKDELAEQLGEKTIASRLDADNFWQTISGKLIKPRKFVEAMENADKLGMFAVRLRAGDTLEQAAYATQKFLFNYRTVSPAVALMRRSGVMPFAAWSAKSIPLQLEMLFKKPGQFMALLRAKDAIENGIPEIPDEKMPEYLENQLGVRVRQNKDGSFGFIMLEGFLPQADVVKPLKAGADFVGPVISMSGLPSIEGFAEVAEDLLGPMAKIPIELASNKDMFTKRTIKEFDEQLAILKVPGYKEGLHIDPTNKNLLQEALGRPFNLVEDLAESINGEIDPRTGKPYSLWHGSIRGALAPTYTRKVGTRLDALYKAKGAREKLGAARRSAQRFKREGRIDAYRRAQAVVRELEKRAR